MSEKKPFYITTTLPYVNSKPHVGFAMELIRADIIARYKNLVGFEVFLNTGTDEHGIKIFQKAEEEKKDVQAYVDEKAELFKDLLPLLTINKNTKFIRTTDPEHVAAAQEFWKRCEKDIEKKTYKVKYCTGCELEKTDSELVDGKCSLHPNLEIEIREEENYFFKFSSYQKQLLELYEKQPNFVIPDNRLKEIKNFVEAGLQDFSISRLKEKMPWGVPVPGDGEHVMYVWFDALVNYISTIGWPEKMDEFEKWWPVTQYCGKDNLRQQSAMWQAMLLSAGLPHSQQIVINGFITSDGQKMSKSLGNVIDPVEVVDKYGADALRYYVARELSPFEDSDMTLEKFAESYTANLVNGLGNQVNRVMKLAEDHIGPVDVSAISEEFGTDGFQPDFVEALEQFDIQKAADVIWQHIQKADLHIQETEPFKKIKSDNEGEREEAKQIIEKLVKHLWVVATHLEPILPETAEKIKQAVRENKKPETPLFERII